MQKFFVHPVWFNELNLDKAELYGLGVGGESASLTGPQTCCLMGEQFFSRGSPSLGVRGQRGQLTWSSGQKSYIFPLSQLLRDCQAQGCTGRMLTLVACLWHTGSEVLSFTF